MSTVSNTGLKKKNAEMEFRFGKIFMECNTNQYRKEGLSSLPIMLWMSQDKNIIQINNTIKTLVMIKEQYKLSKGDWKP